MYWQVIELLDVGLRLYVHLLVLECYLYNNLSLYGSIQI